MSTDVYVYAVIRTGSKQYRVTPGQRLSVERLNGKSGDEVAFSDVLLVRSDDGAVAVGAPTVEGASVKAEIVQQRRAAKINVFKYKSKTRYRRLRGHRQRLTELRISEVVLGEQSWTFKAAQAVKPPDDTETVENAETANDARPPAAEATGGAEAGNGAGVPAGTETTDEAAMEEKD